MEELMLIGNLGSDPDVCYTNGGEKVVSFSCENSNCYACIARVNPCPFAYPE